MPTLMFLRMGWSQRYGTYEPCRSWSGTDWERVILLETVAARVICRMTCWNMTHPRSLWACLVM